MNPPGKFNASVLKHGVILSKEKYNNKKLKIINAKKIHKEHQE